MIEKIQQDIMMIGSLTMIIVIAGIGIGKAILFGLKFDDFFAPTGEHQLIQWHIAWAVIFVACMFTAIIESIRRKVIQ